MCAEAHTRDVVDESQVGDAGSLGPAGDLSGRNGAGIGGVGGAGNEEPDIAPAATQNIVRGEQRADALVLDQPSRERDRDRLVGLGQRHQRVDVDAGAGNKRDALWIDAEPLDLAAIVDVLHQHRRARPIEQRA